MNKKAYFSSAFLITYYNSEQMTTYSFIDVRCFVYNSPHFNLSDIIFYLYSDIKETPILNH